MRELKYDESGGGSSHPELEEIAAYLDGRLSRTERAGIMRHLSVCEECLELFTETAHALRETGTGGVVPLTRTPARRWLPYAAAAALLLALAVPAYLLFFARPSLVVADLVEPLGERRGVAGAVWTGPVYRGVEEEGPAAFRALSFLVGAHLVGFQAAVEAGDSAAAGAAAQRVANYLDEWGLVQEEVERFREAQLDLTADRPAPASRYTRLVEENIEPLNESFSGVHFDFGKWTQAGHIAAKTENRAWCERRKTRRFLSFLLRQDEETIEPQAVAALQRIKTIWDRDELQRADFPRLAAQFEIILDAYQSLGEREDAFLPDE